MARAVAFVFILTVPLIAGCLAQPEGSVDAAAAPPQPRLPDAIIDEALLTRPAFDVLPQLTEYVDVSVDDARLFSEVYLPDGEGPWPTILEMSPYNVLRTNGRGEALRPLLDEDLRQHQLVSYYVPRGYAVVLAHVRGTGNSEGCMDMMGQKEWSDAHDMVEWAASQGWSDGKVGMHGVSYVGTTPHEALVMAPDHLVTVVTVAGVTNQWRNVYQNGVPYDGRQYHMHYATTFGLAPPLDVERGPAWAANTLDAYCDQEEAVAHFLPEQYASGLYTSYWHDRNITRAAGEVTASILYSQGFVDRAVNPMEAVHWFNDLPVPKKGLFHQGGHIYPPRDDYKTIEHAWFDHWLKGIDNGVMDIPTVQVQANAGTLRVGDTWPPEEAEMLRLWLTPDGLALTPPDASEETYRADMALNARGRDMASTTIVDATGTPSGLAFLSDPVEAPVHLAGSAVMNLVASVDAPNTYFLFDLYDVAPDGTWSWLAEGWFNAHLRHGFDRSAPLTPGEAASMSFRFEPREYVFDDGHRIGLKVHGHDGRVWPVDELKSLNTLHYGPEGTYLDLPVLAEPLTVPFPAQG